MLYFRGSAGNYVIKPALTKGTNSNRNSRCGAERR